MLFDGTLDPAGGLRLRDAVTWPRAGPLGRGPDMSGPVGRLHQVGRLSVRSAVPVGVPVRAGGESRQQGSGRDETRKAAPDALAGGALASLGSYRLGGCPGAGLISVTCTPSRPS